MYTFIMTVVVMIANLYGVDMFAKIQDLVAFLLVGSMLILGVIGMLGLGTGEVVHQPYSMATDFKGVVSTIAVAFWLFIGAEYVIPVSKNVKNARRNVPLGMMIGLALICLVQSVMVIGFHNYTPLSLIHISFNLFKYTLPSVIVFFIYKKLHVILRGA